MSSSRSAACAVLAAFVAAGIFTAIAGARNSAVRTVTTRKTDVSRAGTFRVRVTRLTPRRLRVTMVLRVRGRKASTIWMVAVACRGSQTGGTGCAESSTEKPRNATLRRGRNKIQRTVVVTYPAKTRATCAQADVGAFRADGRVITLLRDNPSGGGRGPLVCPD